MLLTIETIFVWLLQEHHLQRALSAQQVYGTSEALVIPIPDIDDAKRQYEQIYSTDYKPPRQYIHAQSLGVDQVGCASMITRCHWCVFNTPVCNYFLGQKSVSNYFM